MTIQVYLDHNTLNKRQAHKALENMRINQPCEDTLAVPVEAYLKAWGALFTHEYEHLADDLKIT